ncbi:MAG: CHAT domain-containing protein [Gemmatimonadales bacterium]
MAARRHARERRRPNGARLILTAFLPGAASLVLCHCAGDSAAGGANHPDLIGLVERVQLARTFEPRLSVPVEYRRCRIGSVATGTVPHPTCAAEADATPPPAILDLAERASRRLRASADPDALHAAALVDLGWSGEDGIPLERSVSYLQTASRLADRSAVILTDLAAALLVRAERHQTPRDLLEAIETADRALELDPQNASARFNLALGLERLGLDGQAQRAWKAFLQVDSVSPWADEARRRPRPPVRAAEPPEPGVGASHSAIAAYVEHEPGAAMFLGWDRALEQWGEAIMADDTLRANGFLRLAGALGEELERRGGDASLSDAVRAIAPVARHRHAARAAARAHRDYAAGLRAYRAGDAPAADRWFGRVGAAPGAPPPLRAWARYHRAAALAHQGRGQTAELVLQQVLAEVDTLRYSSLAGRARWVVATVSLRSGRYERAIQAARSAAPLLERARESENVGAVQTIEADAEQYLPDRTDVYTAIHRAITTLRPHRRSHRLHDVLYNTARLADADRLRRLAVRVQDEGLEVAEGIGEPIWIAEARIARARLLAAAGRNQEAVEDVSAARAIVESLEPGGPRDWFEADLRLAEAVTSLASEPARAVEALDSVARFFGSQQNQIRLLPALVARSKAALALGNVSAATADLDRALTLLDQQGTSLSSVELRASLLDAARQVVDRLVMLRVRAGLHREALADLERARVSLARVGRREVPAARAPLKAPPGQLAAEYALIGDTLLVWTMTGTSVHLERTTVDRARLARTIERVRAALELRTAEPALEQDLAALYDWLVRPIQRQLAGSGASLLLVTDREIGGVPFAALRDTAHNRYLIEDHPLRFASSLRDASHGSPASPPRDPKVLLVADPAFDRSVFPGLARLPGAAAEARAIAAQYGDTTLLDGPAATRTAFEAALQWAGIVHYAGHAVFDDERPEQSLLVLASGRDAKARARITAAELERLDLASVRLVVLSACETIRSRSGRAGGFAGLARAFLAAGAGGVVGSLWRVEDRLTQELMGRFHRSYGHSGDGAAALRAAQLQLLGSTDRAASAPAAWAAFRYAGN